MNEPIYRLDQTFRIGSAGAVYRQVVRSDDIGPYVAGYEVLTLADLIAVVRREVESGTIEGEVVKAWPYEDTACIHMHSVVAGRKYLVLPVSDGGSET